MQTVETSHVFTFVDPDSARYARHVYWEELHAVSFHSGLLLTASRAVPVSDTMFAFYVSLWQAMVDAGEKKLLADSSGSAEKDEPDPGTDIVLSHPSRMLALALRNEGELPGVAVRALTLSRYGDVSAAPPPAGVQGVIGAGMSRAGGAADLPLPPIPAVPPAARGFLRSRYGRLGEIVSRYEQQEDLDPRFHAERMASLVARTEARSLGMNLHWDVTVLGQLAEGELPVNQRDPQNARYSYQVDADANLDRVALKEVTGWAERSLAKTWVRCALHGNIKGVRLLDRD